MVNARSFRFSRLGALSALITLPVLSLTACGGEPPPPAEAPPAPVAKAAPVAIDLSPAPEPHSLVVLARLGRPQATLRTLVQNMGMPELPPGLMAEAITDMPVGDVLDLGQPVDVALTVEGNTRSPKVAWAVSAALSQSGGTEQLLGKHFVLTPGAGGVVRLDLQKDAQDDTDRRCAIYPAYPAPNKRIVCAESESAIRDLAPYLVRTRTRAAVTRDVEVEVRGAPVRGLLTEGRQLFPTLASSLIGSRGVPGLSSLVTEVVGDVIDFGSDVERITLEGNVSAEAADATFKLAFAGSTSLIGRLMTPNADKAGPPPEAFTKLPIDADTAFYGRGWDDRELARPKEMLFSFARNLLDKEGIAKADTQALETAVSGYLSLGSSGWVSAAGSDWPGAAAAVKKLAEARKAGKPDAILDAEAAALQKVSGWSMWGVELPMAKVQATVKDIVAAYNKPSVQKAIKPRLKTGAAIPTFKITPPAAAHKLPKDTLHVELSVARVVDAMAFEGAAAVPSDRAAPKGAAAKKPVAPKLAKPIKVHGFVVPDGGRTWMVWGMDEAVVVARVKSVVAGEGATLATRPGLEPLRDSKFSGAGFFDARAFMRQKSGIGALFESAGNAQLPDENAVPSGDWGKTPVWLGARGEGAGDKRSATLTVRVPRESIRDLASGRVSLGRGRRF